MKHKRSHQIESNLTRECIATAGNEHDTNDKDNHCNFIISLAIFYSKA